jgi:hypothetical protein
MITATDPTPLTPTQPPRCTICLIADAAATTGNGRLSVCSACASGELLRLAASALGTAGRVLESVEFHKNGGPSRMIFAMP